ncbi:MAG: hypothetical protein F2813_02345 [Actinobacteria bacterium]|uniref:Unannotated protein n=1 Tax=freshwater metagenome TaxID=449393 RepID=A0A6J5ZJP3_9ZZZZ|nr:hypothetical protein [Actinomycetota bacterium]
MTPPPTAASATVGRAARPTRERRRSISRPSRGDIVRVGSASGSVVAKAFVGRRLIGVLAAALIGLVFVQVTLLKLNTQISANAERSALLTRQIAEQRSTLAKLDASQRVTGAADNLGLVMPAPDAVCYLKTGNHHACSVNADSINVASDVTGDPSAASPDSAETTVDQGTAASDGAAAEADQTTQAAPDSSSQGDSSGQAQAEAPTGGTNGGGMAAGAGG